MTHSDSVGEVQELATRFIKVFEATITHMSRQDSKPYNPIFSQLNVNQFRAMHLLHVAPGMVQKDLAEKLAVTPAAISTAVRQMERFGLILRKPDMVDARLMRLYLSQDAETALEEINKHRRQSVVKLLEGVPLSEQRMIVESLEKALLARSPSADHCNHIT